jgi:hypothetical protein
MRLEQGSTLFKSPHLHHPRSFPPSCGPRLADSGWHEAKGNMQDINIYWHVVRSEGVSFTTILSHQHPFRASFRAGQVFTHIHFHNAYRNACLRCRIPYSATLRIQLRGRSCPGHDILLSLDAHSHQGANGSSNQVITEKVAN